LNFDSDGSEELADLAGVLENVQWAAADKDAVRHPLVSMSAGEGPSRRLLGERIQRATHPRSAEVDITEEFDLSEHTVGEGVGVLIKRLRGFPRLELSGEVVVKGQQRVVSQNQGAEPCSPPCGVGAVGASSGHRSVSHKSSGQSTSATSINRSARSKLLAML
jgi:hypothetical protein